MEASQSILTQPCLHMDRVHHLEVYSELEQCNLAVCCCGSNKFCCIQNLNEINFNSVEIRTYLHIYDVSDFEGFSIIDTDLTVHLKSIDATVLIKIYKSEVQQIDTNAN